MLTSALLAALSALAAVTARITLPDSPLRNFQVSQPFSTPATPNCTVELLHHLFTNSFGQPARVNYTPPVQCSKPSAVILNLTATSNGTQFDRLASLYLSGVEIWRTSTPEPTPLGIVWTAVKDVSRYASLLLQPGELVLDLGNLLDASSGLNGEYDVRLSAIFFQSDTKHPPAVAPDVILPLSSNNSTQLSAFHLPPSVSTSLVIPRNGAAAFAEIYASGNALEEFWYGNVPDEFFSELPPWNAPDGAANGKGPFREVQLYIDSLLAGVVFPYPVIYTGEFLPSIWRPMVSYGAFDSPTYYIDVTPFLPILSDGTAHNFTLNVAGIGVNHSINTDWIVSGNIQIILAKSSRPTTGNITRYDVPTQFIDPIVTGTTSLPTNVSVHTNAGREIVLEAVIISGDGDRIVVEWEQKLQFNNSEVYATIAGNVSSQTVYQISRGTSRSKHNLTKTYVADIFEFPFSLQLLYNVRPSPPNTTFYIYNVTLDHSYKRQISLPGIQHGNTFISTQQKCNGSQFSLSVGSRTRDAITTEEFHYLDSDVNDYSRSVGVQTVINSSLATTNGSVLNTTSESWSLFDMQDGSLVGRGITGDTKRKEIYLSLTREICQPKICKHSASFAVMQGFNKYYPPDFDPSKHGSLNAYRGTHALGDRARKLDKGILVTRFELPFNIWCLNCNSHIGMGVRYNAEKRKVGNYYSTPIYAFRCKCHLCSGWFEIRTDPQNTRYVVEYGARQKVEDWNPEENGGFAIHETNPNAPSTSDPLAALEKTAKAADYSAKVQQPRLAELHDLSSRYNSDPYSRSLSLRKKFREEKKADKEIQDADNALRDRYGLSKDLKLVSDSEVAQEANEAWSANQAVHRADAEASQRRRDAEAGHINGQKSNSLLDNLIRSASRKSDPFLGSNKRKPPDKPTKLTGILLRK